MKINWNKEGKGSKKLEYKTAKILLLAAFLLFFYSFVSAQDEKRKKDSLKIDGCTVIFDPPSLERFMGTLERRLNEIKSKEKDLLIREAYLKKLEDEISAKLAELIKLKKDVQNLENLCFDKVKQKEEEKVKALQDQKLLFEADQRKTIISYEKRISDVVMEYEKKIKELEAKHRKEIQEYQKRLSHADKSIVQLTDDFKKKMEDLAKNFDKERKKLQDEIEKLKNDYEKKLEAEVKKIKDDYEKKISQLSSSYENKITNLVSEYEKKIKESSALYEKKILDLSNSYEKRISDLVLNYESKMNELQKSKMRELQDLRNSFSQTLSSVIQGYERQINSLLEALRQRMKQEEKSSQLPPESSNLIKEKMEEGLKRMARIISNSTPEDAAKIISSMSEDVAAQVLILVEERRVGKILSMLPQDKARKISDLMLGIRREEEGKKIQQKPPQAPGFFTPQYQPESKENEENIQEENFYQNPLQDEEKGNEDKRKEELGV